MSTTDLTDMGIARLGELIESREVSPVEATAAFLERIETLDGDLNAFISVHPELAIDAARRAEEEISAGRHRGPLHGIPLAVKDLFSVTGTRRTCGSRIMREGIADRDATSVARLKAAGATILGLLNLHEFAYGPTGVNPHFGSSRNPWHRDAVCGGSSSGAGCAVAASLAAGALGTDTGGSIRIPAALCGVVGLKQTYGLASRAGIYPLCQAFDHGGPLARSARDAGLLLAAIAGEDRADPTTRGVKAGDYTTDIDGGIAGVRIGVPREFFFDDLHPDVEARVRDAVDELGRLGARVEAVSLPFIEEAVEAWTTLALAEAWTLHRDHARESGDQLSPDVKARIERGASIGTAAVFEARWAQERIQAEMATLLEEVDLLATPTCPVPAVSIATGTVRVGDEEVDGLAVLGRLTRLASFTGQPAVSVPCGFTAEGLPVGLQLIGGWFEEAALLRAARAYERATPWHERRPGL